jgi:hypothetical protein
MNGGDVALAGWAGVVDRDRRRRPSSTSCGPKPTISAPNALIREIEKRIAALSTSPRVGYL